MKKITAILLTAVMILQLSVFAAFADAAQKEKQIITIRASDSLIAEGDSPRDVIEIESKGIPSDKIEIESLECSLPQDIVIGRSDIAVRDGKYSFRLVLKAAGGLTFDNDLEIYYQGVSGRYKLHYDIDDTDNHTMIVTGTFDNILVASPLLKKIRDRIGEDSYFYQLILKTDEVLSFVNRLSFLLDGNRQEYSWSFNIDLPKESQTAAESATAPVQTVSAADDDTANGLQDQSTDAAADASSREPAVPSVKRDTDIDAVEAKKQAVSIPSKTKITKLAAARRALTVKWSRSSGADGYAVQYSTGKSFGKGTKTVYVGKGATSAKLKGLQKDRRYYVRVRSYKNVSGRRIYSGWSAVRSTKAK